MDIATLFQKAVEYQKISRLDLALACFQEAAELEPEHPAIHYNLGFLHFEQGDFSKAVSSYRQAHQLKPSDPDILYNLAIALKKVQQFADAGSCYEKLLSLFPDDLDARYNLGIIYKDIGEQEKAISCFEQVIAKDINYLPAYSHLAQLHHTSGNIKDAKACYRQIVALDPSRVAAHHMLASLEGKTTDAAPSQYVKNVFDNFTDYDQSMQRNLAYTTPHQLRTVLDNSLPENKTFTCGLDLGCGTGLSGEEFKDIVKTLTGVDLSPVMLAKAYEKGIYSALHEMELNDFLKQNKEKFDLIVAADVFVYIGDLLPLFRLIKEHAAPQASFLFSTEKTEKTYTLQSSGRYAHSEKYIRNLAQDTGFTVVEVKAADIRKEKGEWIRGNLFLLSA